MRKNSMTNKLTVSAMFFALGLILPFFTGQIPQIGKMLSPMHIPVMLCALIVGWKYGMAVGFFLPLVRGMVFGMPVLFPGGTSMAFEMATYGLVLGFLYEHSKKQSVANIYKCLISAMLIGRVVWGISQMIFVGMTGNMFTFQAFLAGAFINAVPAIVLQLVLIPGTMAVLNRVHIISFSDKEALQ